MLKPLRSSTGAGCLIPFVVVWTTLTLGGGVAAWSSGAPLVSYVVILSFLAVDVFLIVRILRPYLADVKLANPEITLSSDALRVGETFTLTYRQVFKRAVSVKRIAIRVLFRESATYRRGTDTVTVVHDQVVTNVEHPGRHYEAGQSFEDQRSLQLPKDGMHSFSASNNKLLWLVQLQIEIDGWPDVNELFPFKVLPEYSTRTSYDEGYD